LIVKRKTDRQEPAALATFPAWRAILEDQAIELGIRLPADLAFFVAAFQSRETPIAALENYLRVHGAE